MKTDLIWEAVRHEQASRRRGTHATKTRALVSGSGKKPWRQKGTGRARVGEVRNPLWRKGGTVFGPQPRDYGYALPKKVARGALRAALAQQLRDGHVTVVDALAAGEIKTKAAAALLKGLGATGKTLVVDVQPEDKFALSMRNIARRAARAGQPGDGARRDGRARGHRHAGGVRGLQEALGMKVTDVIRRPIVTEKTTLAARPPHVVFEVAHRRHQGGHQARRRAAVRSEGRRRAHRPMHGKMKRQGRFVGRRRTGRRPRSGCRTARRCRSSSKARRGRDGIAAMPIRTYKPTSPGRRFQTVQTFDEITSTEPYKPLTEPLKKSGGRNNTRRGHVVVARRRSQARAIA